MTRTLVVTLTEEEAEVLQGIIGNAADQDHDIGDYSHVGLMAGWDDYESEAAIERGSALFDSLLGKLQAGWSTTVPDVWTVPTAVQEMEPGDVYLVGTCGGKRETRRVLEVFPRAMGAAVLHVEDPRGDTFRAHVHGKVDKVERL